MTYLSLGLSISVLSRLLTQADRHIVPLMPAADVFALSVSLRAHRATLKKRAETGVLPGWALPAHPVAVPSMFFDTRVLPCKARVYYRGTPIA
jgi:hypothetical protein